MKLIIIFGPHAVGKMSVGYELEKITGLKLFHNHMTIELVSKFFDYSSPVGKKLVDHFRKAIFEEVSKSDLKGLIFTYVWAFDQQADWDYIDRLCHIFKAQNSEIYFVELEANIETRIERNRHPIRLEHKESKRNIIQSEENLKNAMQKYRLNSYAKEISELNYIRINNTQLSIENTAEIIREKFQL